MISENKENDRKSHKLDDDGGGSSFNWNNLRYRVYNLFERRIMKEFAHFFSDNVLQSRTKSQPGPVIFGEHLVIVLVVIIGLFIVKVKSDLRDKD
ncbi:unnamed protein product [Rhizophagus irregularis]|nr:unnamed protein product [Rhizophagus irregularis]